MAAVLTSREAYEQYERHGDYEALSGLGKLLVTACGEFYSTDRAIQYCDRDTISARIIRGLPNPKHASAFESYFRDIPEDASASNVIRDIREIKRERISGQLSLALANRSSSDTIRSLIGQYTSLDDGYASSAGDGQAELIDVLDTKDLTDEKPNVSYIKIAPAKLNERLDGGALRGHHILLFARPETGKTLFAINMAVGFIKQQLNVIYWANEEPGADLRDRIRGRLLKLSKSQIRSDRAGSSNRLATAALGSIVIAEGTTFTGLRNTLGRRKTDVVIIDQIRNMKSKSESRTAELEAAGIEARNIAKEFNVLVVSVTQAGDSATGKAYIDMSDIDSSKTGIPASADLIIGLGADATMQANGLIGIHLSKNKMSGEHWKGTVTVNYSTGVIE